MLPQVSTAAPWPGERPASVLNLAFTYEGLAAMGVGEDALAPSRRSS